MSKELTRPDRDARRIREQYWDTEVGTQIPVNPATIAEGLGIAIEWDDSMTGADHGCLDPNNGHPVIRLSRDQGLNRRRFTVAHELGHYCQEMYNGDLDNLQPHHRNETSALGTEPDEVYANGFAAELLMPAFAVTQLVSDGLVLGELAQRFAVSTEAMTHRLNNLGLTASV